MKTKQQKRNRVDVLRPVRKATTVNIPEGIDAEKFKQTISECEQTLIVNALHENGYNKVRTAKILGIDRKTLYNKLKGIKA